MSAMADASPRRPSLLLGLAAGTSAAAASLLVAHLRRRQWWAKQEAARLGTTPLPEHADLLRTGFAAKRLPPEIDHIIIGSGLSGLYLACLLSKIGRRVLVLEQHYVAGGCTHTFKDKGYEFDTGVHYLGEGTALTAMMDFGAGHPGAFKLVKQGAREGTEIYNQVHVGDAVHCMRPGPKTYLQDLFDKFPQQEQAIRRFFRLSELSALGMLLLGVKQYLPESIWNLLLQLPSPLRLISRLYIQRSLNEALDDCGVQDEKLRAFLSAEFGDHGCTPETAPLFLHCAILNHYRKEGGFYPLGGSDAFAQALVPAIFAAGGAVLVRAPVSRIVVEDGRAIGVDVKGKGVIRARCSVISSAGVEVTFRKLLDEAEIQKSGGIPKTLLEAKDPSCPGLAHHVYGFFGFEGTAEELDLPTYNIWSFPPASGTSDCLTNSWQQLFGPASDDSELPAFLASDEAAANAQVPAFIGFPSAKDETYNLRCPGKSVCVVITESRAAYFQEPGPSNKRSETYRTIKRRYGQVLRNAMCRHWPHLRSKVSFMDVGTPWSNEHYLGRVSSYGLDVNPERFLDPTLRIRVPNIQNLYMTGQDFFTCGIFGCPVLSWITLSKVLGVTSFDFWLLLADFCATVGRRVLFDKTYVAKLR